MRILLRLLPVPVCAAEPVSSRFCQPSGSVTDVALLASVWMPGSVLGSENTWEVEPDREIGHVAGSRRHVIELENVGAGSARERVGTASRNEDVISVAAVQLRAGI